MSSPNASKKLRGPIVGFLLLFAPTLWAGEWVDITGILPSGGVYATFHVGNEVFHASITNPTSINDAIALWRGKSNKKIPVGKLSCTAAAWNAPWHWQQVPSTVTFSTHAIEVCDGIPSYVEAHCAGFGIGYYCPWNAKMVELRDCRSSTGTNICPLVPKM